MNKLAIGLIALSILTVSMASPAAAQDPWGWMYLSTDPDTYTCDDGIVWDSGAKPIYIVVEIDDAEWMFGDGFNGAEFSVDYPSALFFTSISSPQAPNALFIGSCNAGHCSYGMGTGGASIPNNPWTAVQMDFLKFGPGENLGFSLGPSDTPSQRAQGGPAWAYYDANDPPLYIPQSGDGSMNRPGWQQGFVMLNYNDATASTEPFPRQVFRDPTPTEWPAENAGHPCDRTRIVPTEETSWGSLKAGY